MRLDLIALKHRCLFARKRGYKIAKAALHAANLRNQLPSNRSVASPDGVEGSIPHLLALIEALMQRKSPAPSKPVPEVVPPPKREPVEPEKLELAEPEEQESLKSGNPDYASMTYQQLYDEAAYRGIPGRSGRNKEGLIALLSSNDQES